MNKVLRSKNGDPSAHLVCFCFPRVHRGNYRCREVGGRGKERVLVSGVTCDNGGGSSCPEQRGWSEKV